MVSRLTESLIVKVWQYELTGRNDLLTEEGEPIKIIYPGRINDDRGADLVEAVIRTWQGLRKGDIEVHLRSRDWQAHGHDQDPTYNRVMLHVVMWQDSKFVTRRQNGEPVSILALNKYIQACHRPRQSKAPVASNLPCRKAIERLTPPTIARFLDRAGEERFFTKAARFQAELTRTEASELLYQGIMSALGYAKNKIPCLELARRLPLRTLAVLAQDKASDEECLAGLQARLLGTAGLLPSARSRRPKDKDEWTAKLEKIWASLPQNRAMSEKDWHLFKVRPNNSPLRRIVAMSYLILRYRERGIFAQILDRIRDIPVNGGHDELEKMLVVTSQGYWADHFDFGLGGLSRRALLGAERAADIMVNVVLPFAYSWSRLSFPPELAQKVLELYRNYPRLSENTIEKHMSQQLRLNRELVSSAQRQQGLIHIYRTLCAQGNCSHCPLSQASN